MPLHSVGSSLLGNGDHPCLTIDPADATGATAWFAFAVPSGYGGCSASAISHTTDGGATIAPLLMPAHPWAWGNGTPYSFRLLPVTGPSGTVWTMLYAGGRVGYDTDLFARQLTSAAAASSPNQVLHLAGSLATGLYDMAEVPSTPAMQFSSKLTVEMWVSVAPGASIGRGLEILQWGRVDDALAFRGYASSGGNSTLSGRFRTTDGNYGIGGAPITDDGGWHHVAMSYDAAAGPLNLRFYVDGHLYQSVTATGNFIPAPEPLVVGGISSGWGLDPLNGDVDSLRLWNRALSEDEIRASARQASLTGSETGLAAAFSFDGTMKDISGNGADGMLQFGANYLNDSTVPAALMSDWADDFSSNRLRPAFWQTAPASPSFTLDTSHGDVRLSKPAGAAGSDIFTMESVWRAVGDFDVSFDFRDAVLNRSMNWGNHLGLTCVIGTTSYYFIRSDENELGQNIRFGIQPGWWTVGLRSTSTAGASLRIIRRAAQMTTFIDGEIFAQTDCETGPMTCLMNLFNNTTPDAISATFDNFKISATSLERRWVAPGTFDTFADYAEAKGLVGPAAAPLADPDEDGVNNLLEYAAGTDPKSAASVPPALAIGSEGMAESGQFLTLTIRLAKPVPTDLNISAEFAMDPGMTPWMFTDISGSDSDQGDHIDRTFKAPLMIGFPPTGFMRVRVTSP